MSGRKISDHSNWTGAAEKGGVFAKGSKMKQEMGAEGAGHLGMEYPDTTEMIKRDQEKGIAKAKAHKIKEGYRN